MYTAQCLLYRACLLLHKPVTVYTTSTSFPFFVSNSYQREYKLDLLGKPSDGSKPLLDMAKVSRTVPVIHRHHPNPVSINDSTEPVTSKPPSRRGSRIGHRGPEIVIDPPPEDSLYPSLTTLGSLDDSEDELSCKDCCKSGVCVCLSLAPSSIVSCVYTAFPLCGA